jgi:hypothetical protein
MFTASVLLPGLLGGGLCILAGVLCFVFNKRLGVWIRRFPLVAFGIRERKPADEIIYRGLACVAGLLCAGAGLALLGQALRW